MTAMLRALGAMAGVVALLGGAAGPASGHRPAPVIGWPAWYQDQIVRYRWMTGEVPPAAMRTAIRDGAADANESKYSRSPTFVWDSGGSSTVEYGSSVFCGVNGLACADARNAPSSFRVAFREHGHRFDWGTLRWCQMLSTVTDGCFDAENIMLDEIGHVAGLDHHVNYADDRDYGDSVVQAISRARPREHWNAHDYGRCDVARLQTRYDMTSWSAGYSTCLNLIVSLSLGASATSIQAGTTVTFSALLHVADNPDGGRLDGNPISNRRVELQRRRPGTSTWTVIGPMAADTAAGSYVLRQSPTATYEWRAVFARPTTEGLLGDTGGPLTVKVWTCSGSTCPQSAPADQDL